MSITDNLRSRRSIISGALAGAAGMVVGRLGGAPAVRAADGDPLILGAANEATEITQLQNTTPGRQALLVSVLGGGVGVRADSEQGEGLVGSTTGGSGVFGIDLGRGNGVAGTSDLGNGVSGGGVSGNGVLGTTVNGVAVLGEVAAGPGLALKTLGPVQFSTAMIATIGQGQSSVTLAPVTGEEDVPLDLTTQTKVLCTLLGNAGAGRLIWYVSIDPDADTFTVYLTTPAKASVGVACFVLN